MLSDEQIRVEQSEGHVHVVAIPGSGKTRVLIAKTLRLLNTYPGVSIYIVTFTNAAAAEISERLKQSGAQIDGVTVGTFHALMVSHIQKYSSGDRLISTEQETAILHKIYVDEFGGHEGYEHFEEYIRGGGKNHDDVFHQMKTRYIQALGETQSQSLTFLLEQGVDMMMRGKIPLFPCHHLLIDEFQDVDEAQLKLAILHGKSNVQITACGDDDQSIYYFRRALGVTAFEALEQHLGSVEHQLTMNYRSCTSILDAAFNLIEHNEHRIDKTAQAFKQDVGSVRVQRTVDKHYEAEYVCDFIKQSPTTATLILARNNLYFEVLEYHLLQNNIDFYRVNNTSYFSTMACQLVISGIEAIARNEDHGITRFVHNILKDPAVYQNPLTVRGIISDNVPKMPNMTPLQRDAFQSITNAVKYHQLGNVEQTLHSLTAVIPKELQTQGYEKTDRIYQLVNIIGKMKGSLAQRLMNLTQKSKPKDSTVRLMTMHASKGLEAPRVVIVGCSNRIMPSLKPSNTPVTKLIEEERRLLFVAITRAQEELLITSIQDSENRTGWYGDSMFLNEIGELEE